MKFRCSICLSPDYLVGGFSAIKCGHVFHSSCITSWLVDGHGKDCPNCRKVCSKRDIFTVYLTEQSSDLDTTVVEGSTDEAEQLNEYKNRYHQLQEQFAELNRTSSQENAEAAENKIRLIEADANVVRLNSELQKSKDCQRLIAQDNRNVRKERDECKKEANRLRDENQQLQWLRVCTNGSMEEVDSILTQSLTTGDSISIRQNLAACIGVLKKELDSSEKARKKLQAECDGWSSKELQLTIDLNQRKKTLELLKVQIHDLEEERHRNLCKISSLSKMLNHQPGIPQTQIRRFIAESPAPQELLKLPEDSSTSTHTPQYETAYLPQMKKLRILPVQLETFGSQADCSLAFGKKAGSRRDAMHFPKSKSANPFKKSIFGVMTPIESSETGDVENATPWLERTNQTRKVIRKKNDFALKFDQLEDIVIDDSE